VPGAHSSTMGPCRLNPINAANISLNVITTFKKKLLINIRRAQSSTEEAKRNQCLAENHQIARVMPNE
jgi:hypothetical protein